MQISMLPTRMRNAIFRIWSKLFPFHSAAWDIAYQSVSEMVNAPGGEEQARLFRQWRDTTLSQLSYVALIGAVVSAVVVGTFSWPTLSEISVVPLTMIRIAWYNSLVLGITAVAVAMQQSVFLVRVGCVSNGDVLIRELLSVNAHAGRRIPCWDQLFIWQAAVGLLEWSIYFWFGGYMVFIWDRTQILQEGQQKSDQVVAGCCYIVFLAGLLIYIASMLRLWYSVWRHKDLIA